MIVIWAKDEQTVETDGRTLTEARVKIRLFLKRMGEKIADWHEVARTGGVK